MALESTKTGLVVRVGEYEPLRAFSQGGRYWDRAAQQIIRQGALAEFLPPVEVEEDDLGKFGRFHCKVGGRELLGGSRQVSKAGVPPGELVRLSAALNEFREKATNAEVQPQNRELIERFQLPDFARHPELYRLVGPWWDRRLKILWGCERNRECSLPAQMAVAKLAPDRSYHRNRWLRALLLFLVLLLSAWWLSQHWPPIPGAWRQTQQARSASDGAVAPPPGAGRGAEPVGKPSERSLPPAGAEQAKARADQTARAAKQAQSAADKARAEAERARKDAAASQAEDARKRKKAADAEAAATKAEEAAKQALAAADQAKAEAAAATEFQIVLSEQGQPAVDGTMEVVLEVRNTAEPTRSVAVESWSFDDQSIRAQDQLRTRMKGGDHAVKAVLRDAEGWRREIAVVVTVEPGKVIATGGKVSVKPEPK